MWSRSRAAHRADRAAPTGVVPTRMSTPCALVRLRDERRGLLVADAREDARRDLEHRGLDAEFRGGCCHLEPDQAAADDDQRLASMQVILERARLRLGAQVIDAGAAGREHRQHPVDRTGGEHERVVADALAGIGHDHPRRTIDRRHPRAALEHDAGCGDAFRAGDRRVVGRELAREHRLRQRRLLVGFVMFVVEQHHLGRGVLLLGGHCRRHPRRSAPDDDDLACAAHARSADSISSMYSSPLAITSIEA